jgi:hypothetical protein
MKYKLKMYGPIEAFPLKGDLSLTYNGYDSKGKDGDYLVIDDLGFIEILKKKDFEEKYEPEHDTIIPSVFYDTCIDGKPHEYPASWGSIAPISCKKCGHVTLNPYNGIIISSTDYSNKS